ADVRAYQPGDDVRAIDWNVTARLGQPFLKRFVEERELTVLFVVDASASLDFGSRLLPKREVVAELAALLAFSALHNNDRVGLLQLRDAETDAPLLVDTASAAVRAAYAAAAERRRAELARAARAADVDLIEVSTAGDHLDALVAFFRRRQRRLRSP